MLGAQGLQNSMAVRPGAESCMAAMPRCAQTVSKRLHMPLVQAQQLLHAGMHTLPSRRLAALPQDAAHEEDTLEALVLQNIKILEHICSQNAGVTTQAVVEGAPALLLEPSLQVWDEFLDGYGIESKARQKLLSTNPQVVHHDVHTAGMSILVFRSYGWSHKDIKQRIVHLYPTLLTVKLEQYNQVLEALAHAGCEGEELRRLLWEFPRIFLKGYKRQIARFARLGLYGLTDSQVGQFPKSRFSSCPP